MSNEAKARRDKGRQHRSGARISLPPGKSMWRIEFTHPVLVKHWQDSGQEGKRPLTVRKSLGTSDRNEASALKEQFQRILDDETLWFALPTDIDPRVENIWQGDWWITHFDMALGGGVRIKSQPNHKKPKGDFVSKRESQRLEGMIDSMANVALGREEPAMLINSSVKYTIPESARDFNFMDLLGGSTFEIQKLRSEVKQLQRDLTLEKARTSDLAEKLKARDARLKAIDRRLVVEEDAMFLSDALTAFLAAKAKGVSAKYLKRVEGILAPFVRAACKSLKKSKTSAYDVSEAWVSEFVRNYLKRDGTPASMKYKKDLRTYLGQFMAYATKNRFDTKLIKLPTRNAAQSGQQIVWLDADESERLLAAVGDLEGGFWQDIASVQRYMGWRTSELIWLKASGVQGEHLQFEAFFHPHTKERIGKTGSRRIAIPTALLPIIKRRVALAEHDILFPLKNRISPQQKKWDAPYCWAWGQDRFQTRYRTILRKAAEAAGISKPIDSRTLRRSFASQLLRDGRSVQDVATLLGDDPATIRKHYARILPDEIDPNFSFVK